MATNFPTSKDTVGAAGTLPVEPTGTPLATSHIAAHQNESDAIIALETKVGINASADSTSLDYKLKNAASVNPGHLHSMAAGMSDVNITSIADGNVLVYNAGQSKWINNTTSAPDASTTVKGVTKMSVAPAVSSSPIAAGDNDPRVVNYYAETGAANAYVITPSPSIGAYAVGQRFSFKAANGNTTTSTLNVNGLGAITIKRLNGSTNLVSGDIATGQIVEVEYDGTNFQMLSPSALEISVNGAAQGDVIYFNGSAWTRLAAGTSGNFLQTLGGSSNPQWAFGLSASQCGLSSWTTSSTGAQTIAHGLGKTPKLLRVTMWVTTGATAYYQSVGTYDGTHTSTVWVGIGAGGGIGYGTDGGNIIFYSRQQTITSAQASATVDATNINLTWSKTGSPTDTISFMWEVTG